MVGGNQDMVYMVKVTSAVTHTQTQIGVTNSVHGASWVRQRPNPTVAADIANMISQVSLKSHKSL